MLSRLRDLLRSDLLGLIHVYHVTRSRVRHAEREASWRRVFDLYAPLLFNLYHYLEQTLHFGLAPENQF